MPTSSRSRCRKGVQLLSLTRRLSAEHRRGRRPRRPETKDAESHPCPAAPVCALICNDRNRMCVPWADRVVHPYGCITQKMRRSSAAGHTWPALQSQQSARRGRCPHRPGAAAARVCSYSPLHAVYRQRIVGGGVLDAPKRKTQKGTPVPLHQRAAVIDAESMRKQG